MFRNFLITSLRILWRNKVVSAINILSLSIGITAFILILLYVHHETSYDKFNENYDRIYRLEGDGWIKLSPAFGDHIRDRIPEIEDIVQIQFQDDDKNLFNIGEEENSSLGIKASTIRADSTLFDIFTYNFIKGDPKTALSEPHTAVLTESTARKLFGDADPLGKTIAYNNNISNDRRYRIRGIVEDVAKSHFDFDAILSFNSPKRGSWSIHATYLLLTQGADSKAVEKKVNKSLQELNIFRETHAQIRNFHLRPMRNLYLSETKWKEPYGEQGDEKLLWSFVTVGVFVLMLAIINYINLTTARGTLRSKEVILKKVMGSGKGLLKFQFIGESILTSAISYLLALTALQLLLPMFNELASVDIDLAEYNTPLYWLVFITALLLTGLVSGLYPAILLTSFRSVANIKEQSFSGSRGVRLRQTMLTMQFCISIILIIAIITNMRQLNYVKGMDLGFKKDHVLLIETPGGFEQLKTYQQTLKENLLGFPNIKKISFFSGTPLGEQSTEGLFVTEWGDTVNLAMKRIDPDYMDVMGMELIEGRNFMWDRKSDLSKFTGITWIVNETAASQYWSASPVGRTDHVPYRRFEKIPIKTIGIVRDVHYQSARKKVEPMVYIWKTQFAGKMGIKISGGNISETISTVSDQFKNVYGDIPFLYSFMNEEFDALYKSDERATTIVGYFTVLAIVIACMGLFGLSSFMAVRRTKEIGIRKALGASSNTIFVMLSREYIKWILLSALIASPIAWFAMNRWLESFAYRIELGPGVFIIAAIIALAIGLITVGWQALKSAVANPVEALRYE